MFKLQISSKLLDELSLLYSDKFKAIGEIIINSIDSGATKVWIITQTAGEIIVLDNGSGMSEQDIIDKYLLFGYSYKQLERIKDSNRPVVGRKGIAKVSGLSIADRMTITSWQKTKKHIFRIDRDEYLEKKYISDYKIPHNECDMSGNEIAPTGTEVKLSKLRLSQGLDEKELIEHIAVNLPVFYGDLEIRVNGVKVQRSRIPFDDYLAIDEEHPILGKITGELFKAKSRLNPFQGVITRVRGMVVGKPSIFKSSVSMGIFGDFIGGEIESVGAFEHNDEGLITTGRESFISTNPLYQEYEKYITRKIEAFVNGLIRVKEQKRRKMHQSAHSKSVEKIGDFISATSKERFGSHCKLTCEAISKAQEVIYDKAGKTIIVNTDHPAYKYAVLHKWTPYHIARCAIEEVALQNAKDLQEYKTQRDKMLKLFTVPALQKAEKDEKEKQKTK